MFTFLAFFFSAWPSACTPAMTDRQPPRQNRRRQRVTTDFTQLNLRMEIFKHTLKGTAILGGFVLCIFSSAAGTNVAATARNELRVTLQNWTKAFNARNVPEVYTLFAPDLISNYQGQPAGDYHSLCAQLRTSLSDPDKSYHYSFRINEIQVFRDLAIVRLTWHLRVNHKGFPGEDFVEETSLDIFRRQPDGSWKISRFNAYPSKTN
jgi:ketosteroid isomerase-like protein